MTRSATILGVVVLVLAISIFAVTGPATSHEICVQSTIEWHEDLYRDDMPFEHEPRSSPVVIRDQKTAQALYRVFASQEHSTDPEAGWISCVIVQFKFADGHYEYVWIDSELACWSGLFREGDHPVPDEFVDVFAREFGIIRRTL